jgi:hypothetical protein
MQALTEKMIEKLTIVTTEGTTYLCELHETHETVELRNAIVWQSDLTIHDWILGQNIDELKSVRIAKGAGFVESRLTQTQRRALRQAWEDMHEVKQTALRRLENQYYAAPKASAYSSLAWLTYRIQ